MLQLHIYRLSFDQRLVLGVAVAAAIFVICLLVWLVRRRKVPGDSQPELAAIDVEALEVSGPFPAEPRLEFYGTPVRLGVLVIAPVGRDGQLPPTAGIPDLLEQVVPGLKAVLAGHAPEIVCWPEQLSSQGFIQSFFKHVRLPGDRGKDSRWCSVAGRFRASGRYFLAGLALCAAHENGLGQFGFQHEGQWIDALRIKART